MALLEGLEAVEMKLSEVRVENAFFRIDNEFFLKTYIQAEQQIKCNKYIKLLELVDVITDYHANGSYASLNSNVKILSCLEYSYMVRSTDLERDNFLTDVRYVNEYSYNFLKKSKLYGGELLVNKIGKPGQFYLAPELKKPMTLGMNLFLIKLKPNVKYNNHFLWVYFNTQLGQRIVRRKINGTAPFSIDKNSILSLLIPVLSIKFQDQISNLVTTANDNLEKSKALYAEAEHILLKELDLVDFKPSTDNIAIKTLSESFGTTGRLDAEYYQPKYDGVLEIIQKKYCDSLGDIVVIKKSIEPGSDAYQDNGIPFIRVANLSKEGISHSNIYLDPASFSNKKLSDLQPKKNTILLSKDGTVGIAYNIKTEQNIITSGALLHLQIRKDNILPEYLTLVLNSMIVQMQSDRDVGGSIIKHWIPSEIAKITIPIIDLNIQEQIEGRIQQSFVLRKGSKHLLSVAKQAVELAIEENEDRALDWINEQIEG